MVIGVKMATDKTTKILKDKSPEGNIIKPRVKKPPRNIAKAVDSMNISSINKLNDKERIIIKY